MTKGCLCRCGCAYQPIRDGDGLCGMCWREWCEGNSNHAPRYESSYLNVYGLGNPWSVWLLGRASEVMAQAPRKLATRDKTPPCPDSFCGMPMVKRSGGWKCYRHGIPIEVSPTLGPFTPKVTVIRLAEEEKP